MQTKKLYCAKDIIPFLDFTSLNDSDSKQSICEFLAKVTSANVAIAAVCVYPKFVALAKKILQGKNIFVATVVNFPNGNNDLQSVLAQTTYALQEGADEIDLVCNYKDYLSQKKSTSSIRLIQQVKNICQTKQLKVILETGELQSAALIQKASEDALLAGADFLKTSTGKTKQGANIIAVRTMLNVIKNSHKKRGLKISGGIKTYHQALNYILLIENMGLAKMLHPSTFRIGASSLLADLLKNLDE